MREGRRGSLINFDDRDPNNFRRVAVKCGGPCGQWFRWRKYTEWPGRCADCSLGERRERWNARREQRMAERAANPPRCRQLEPVIRLPASDITIERDPTRPTYGWVSCPVCQDRRYVHIPTGKKRGRFTGRCRKHGGSAILKRRGVWLHPTGTEIFFDERAPGERQKVGAKCHGCGEKKFVWVIELRRETWSGLCHDCIKQRRPYNRRADDVSLPSGSVVHFGESITDRKYERVPITCGLCGERWQPRRWHALKNVQDPEWSGYCPECRHRPARAFARLRERVLQASSNNAQEGAEDLQRFLKAVEAVSTRWETVRSFSGSRENRLKKLDQLEIGAALGVTMDPYDDKLNRNRVKRELERLGVHEVFPGDRGGFRAFVKAVADGIDEGSSAEEVALRLWRERSGAKKAA